MTTPCGQFFTGTGVFLWPTPWTADDTLLTNDSNCVWQLLALAWILFINPESLVDGAVVGCSTAVARLLGALGDWTGVFGGIGASPLEILWGEQDLLFSSSWNDTAIGRISGWTNTNMLFSFNSRENNGAGIQLLLQGWKTHDLFHNAIKCRQFSRCTCRQLFLTKMLSTFFCV